MLARKKKSDTGGNKVNCWYYFHANFTSYLCTIRTTLWYHWAILTSKRTLLIQTHKDAEKIKAQVLHWVRSFIVKLHICPFASHVLTENRLGIKVSAAESLEEALEELMRAIYHLDEDIHEETTLLIFPYLFADFSEYLDYVGMAENLLSMESYDGIYQLATFHPDYVFADVSNEDVSNYTNRSPYPMVHILRESSLDKAIAFYGDTESIPAKNIQLMHQLGLDKIQQLMQVRDE
ncbi:MAG: DUF1415 domain-containing protein [Legionellaceae bacterium]|nr:DUF1415 domain-containing protein [Legionellaceae bacterium]